MDLEFNVTETITRYSGIIDEIHYQFEEFTVENVSIGITNKKERRSRIYDTNITRKQYNHLSKTIIDALSFDDFIRILRPFIMGYYQNDELEQAFRLLDKDHSGFIQIDELANFLSIINHNTTTEALVNYNTKVFIDADQSLTYDQFRSIILKGIGRDIICNHI